MIVLMQPSHILIRNNTLLVNSKETKSTVSDDIKVLLLSDKIPLKIPFECLEAGFRHWEASWIWAPRLRIIIRSLPDIVDHILSQRWEDVIQGKVAEVTKHRHLGTRCAVGSLATINNPKKHSVV